MYERLLVRRILQGDKRAGEHLVTVHYDRLYRMLRCLTGNSEIAQDLTQQTFLNTWKSLSSFRWDCALGTWLHRVAYHEYTHWLRSRRDHLPLEAAQNVSFSEADSEWTRLVLPGALARLSPEHREAFLLYYIQEFTVTETAQVLNVPAGTVKSRLFAARQQLRQMLLGSIPESFMEIKRGRGKHERLLWEGENHALSSPPPHHKNS